MGIVVGVVGTEVLATGEGDLVAFERTLKPGFGQVVAEALHVAVVAVEADVDVARNRFAEVVHGADGPFVGLEAFGSHHRLWAGGSFLAEYWQYPVAIGRDFVFLTVLEDELGDSLQDTFGGVVVKDDVGKCLSVIGATNPFGAVLVLSHELSADKGGGRFADGALHPTFGEPIGQALQVDVGAVDGHLDVGPEFHRTGSGVDIEDTIGGVPGLYGGRGRRCHQFVFSYGLGSLADGSLSRAVDALECGRRLCKCGSTEQYNQHGK